MLSLLFKPKLSYDYLDEYFNGRGQKKITSDDLYSNLEKLVAKAYPSQEDATEKKWDSFWIPLKEGLYLISVPVHITFYDNAYYMSLYQKGDIEVKKGTSDYDSVYYTMVKEIQRFIWQIKITKNRIIAKTFPYEMRTGAIKGKYIMDSVISSQERKEIEEKYKLHQHNCKSIQEISLKDYLDTAAICYSEAYGEQVKDMTPKEMHKMFADTRHGGMLNIKKSSAKEFTKWLKSNSWHGAHPFEIVFHMTDLGIHLYPPLERKCYTLSSSSISDAPTYLKMVQGLLKTDIPFYADNLNAALDYATGESLIEVNTPTIESFFYHDTFAERRKYFDKISWDELRLLKWR